jgi:ATP-dependent exoDNAse (exonuclease V) alpha subunit
LIIAKPRARRRTREGMPLSGIWRNSRIVTAERSTVSCSVALAAISDKEESVKMKNNFFISVQVLRQLEAAWTCLFDKDVDLSRSLGKSR